MCEEMHLLMLSFAFFHSQEFTYVTSMTQFLCKGKNKNHLLLLLYVHYYNVLHLFYQVSKAFKDQRYCVGPSTHDNPPLKFKTSFKGT